MCGLLCVYAQYQDYSDGRGTAEYYFKHPFRAQFRSRQSSNASSRSSEEWSLVPPARHSLSQLVPQTLASFALVMPRDVPLSPQLSPTANGGPNMKIPTHRPVSITISNDSQTETTEVNWFWIDT